MGTMTRARGRTGAARGTVRADGDGSEERERRGSREGCVTRERQRCSQRWLVLDRRATWQ